MSCLPSLQSRVDLSGARGNSAISSTCARPQELVDRQQFLQPVSALLQGARIAREAAGIARAVDHARAPSTAPARPIAPLHRRAADRAARRRRHRARPPSADCGRDRAARPSALPLASRRAAASIDTTACRSLSNSASLPARPNDSAPMPGEQVGQSRGIARPFATAARIACSARRVACRKAPGGGSILASPKTRSGWRRTTIGSADARSPQLEPRQVRTIGQRHQRFPPSRATGRGACADGPAGRGRCRCHSRSRRPPRRPAGSRQGSRAAAPTGH